MKTEIFRVSSLLEELVDSEGDRQPSDIEVRAAVWEACGDSGALQLLIDLLNTRMMDLEEGSGTEDSDTELLEKIRCYKNITPAEGKSNGTNEASKNQEMSRNKWASIVYRRGQKQLTRQFLKEAGHALQLALSESN
ncbi:hypothetical protein R6Q59_016852 [Mikania micrantha]